MIGYFYTIVMHFNFFWLLGGRTRCRSRTQCQDLLLITGCQFKIEFSFCAHSVRVCAPMIPSDVDPAVVQFAGNSTYDNK
jgi:hypothetical protein